MITPDLINALFEAFGALAILGHCKALYNDKRWEGISWPSVFFFFSWGLWNLYYYPFLGQWFSTVAGISIAVANSLWLYLLWKYRHN